jgi:hypothetical protein
VPVWLRDALMIQEKVREFSGDSCVGSADTLAIVFHEVCVRCNTTWMATLETRVRPVLEPLLLGARKGTSLTLGPDQQTLLATWAVKTGLLLALSKFRRTAHGWIPDDTLQWLYQHHSQVLPPPGSRVWMAGFDTSDIPGSVQAACIYGNNGPAAQAITFTVGCVLFQVFAPRQQDASLTPGTEAWLAPEGALQLALLPIAPATSPLRWPPSAVCTASDRELVAGRLAAGLTRKA